MKSRKYHEGYLLIDHTFSPGVPDELIAGLEGVVTAPAGKKLEAATLNCAHCNKDVVINPKRTRARGYCSKCDRFICDMCEGLKAIHGCKSFRKVIDELQEEYGRNLNIGEI